jgi:hypothetical protein
MPTSRFLLVVCAVVLAAVAFWIVQPWESPRPTEVATREHDPVLRPQGHPRLKKRADRARLDPSPAEPRRESRLLWDPEDWQPDAIQTSYLKSLELYSSMGEKSDPPRAKSLARLLRRFPTEPPLTPEERADLRIRIRSDQTQITECTGMVRAEYIASYVKATRLRLFEKLPKFEGGLVTRMNAREQHLASLRLRLGAAREEDWSYSVHTSREYGNIIFYLVRSPEYREFFELRDRLRQLQERRGRKIEDFVKMVRPK